MIRLRNHHTGHKNGGTGSGTLKPFRSDSGACVDVSKSNTRMSTYDIGMYRDTLGHFQVGSVSEGQFGNRKCTLMGAWAGTRRGLSRRVLYGLRGNEFGAELRGNEFGAELRGNEICLAIDKSPIKNHKSRSG